jgi:ABC-type Fe3+-citrate transport system substrate-binding protein
MRKSKIGKWGWVLALALGIAAPSVPGVVHAASKKTSAASSDSSEAAAPAAGLSKEDQEKLKEHNKLRAEIKKVKYPASKADVVAHVKGIKPDDKKWFSDTLPEKTYSSADEVFSALGWETAPAPAATK